MAQESFEGGCLCGRVRYQLRGPTLWSAHCHCSLCRRAHGAAFVTWVGSDRNRFLLLSSNGDLQWYASSEDSRRGFCRRCGTTLFFESERWPGEVHVTRASLDGPIDREPAAHGYWESHVDWFEPGDDLPRRRSDQD